MAKNSWTVSATLGPMSLTRVSVLFAGGDELVDAAELVGESLRGALADVADAEAEQDAIQRGLL